MSEYKELLRQREALEQQIAEMRQSERATAIAQVRAIVEDFGLTMADAFGKARRADAGKTVPPKYRHPETGATWTGRGRAPDWIASGDRDSFLIS
ncbi:H-NS family nucleoid-associated regulatory protein [Pseudorhodoferax sp. Leaf265]|uniref:H-NS histone family protein n=1 Tax=Pseudorhodoferax sp. Leaf265 TaxID=1736315 RepID=UPI0009E764FD|nr:H-NS histone family protein [Pseudorhodoferax sp. Leaf265]